MIIEDLKDMYVIKCSSNSEIEVVRRMNRRDILMCYDFCWTLNDFGPQIFDREIYFTYFISKEQLSTTELICKKTSNLRSFINHILYFQKLRGSL